MIKQFNEQKANTPPSGKGGSTRGRVPGTGISSPKPSGGKGTKGGKK